MNSLKEIQSALKKQALAEERFKKLERKREDLEALLFSKENEVFQEDIKEKRQQIDTLMDNLESESHQDRKALLQQLKDNLAADHPHQYLIYEALEKAYLDCTDQKDKIEKLYHFNSKIYEHLEKIVTIRKEIKKKWIWSYIFGPNPNSLIGKHLEKICQLTSSSPQALGSYREFLTELSIECKTKWNYRHLDQKIYDLYLKAQEWQKYYESEFQHFKRECEVRELNFNHWIQSL